MVEEIHQMLAEWNRRGEREGRSEEDRNKNVKERMEEVHNKNV